MSAARDPLPFDPVSLGADFDFDIEFYLADETQPDDQSGATVRIAFARRCSPPRALLAGEVFDLTTDDWLEVDLKTIKGRVPGTVTGDWIPGVYEAEVRMTRPDGSVESVLSFIQPIVKGAGATAAGDVGAPPAMTGGAGTVRKLFRDTGRYRVIRGQGGVRGPAGASISIVDRPAARALSGHRCVIATPEGLFDYPDLDVAGDGPLIVGVTIAAAGEAYAAYAQTHGLLEDDSFAFAVGPVFCGPNGELVQTPPTGAAFLRRIGTALDATALQIDLDPAILAAEA